MKDRFPMPGQTPEDHVGVRVGMFEMRGIWGISAADKIFTMDGNIRSNGMGNTIDNARPEGPELLSVYCVPLLVWTLPTVTFSDPANSSRDNR